VDAMSEAKVERGARAAKQILALFTQILEEGVLRRLFPQTITLSYERLL